MREMVGQETTLKDLFNDARTEKDEEYAMAYVAMIQSTLSPITERKVNQRTSAYIKQQFKNMLASGKKMSEINGAKLEGYRAEYIFALEDAVKWEMSILGKILRTIMGKEILRWDKVLTISEIRR
jgi:hypothetical protein